MNLSQKYAFVQQLYLNHLMTPRNFNGMNGAEVTPSSQIKMEEEQRRQCQDILDKIPEHKFLMQQMKQEPMVNNNDLLPPPPPQAGHAPRGRPPASLQNGGMISPDRKHVCPHCYKAFKSRQQLMQHNLVHSNLRKYHCNFCERTFKQLSHLHQHHRIHTGEKPYRCPLDGCDKAFPQLSNLQHHIRNHDKLMDSNFQCMLCDRAYPNEATLKAHNTRMHLHARPLDLRQHSVSMAPPSPMVTASIPSFTTASIADSNSQQGNVERQRKRKAAKPQHLYMPPTMVPLAGPLTPEDENAPDMKAKRINSEFKDGSGCSDHANFQPMKTSESQNFLSRGLDRFPDGCEPFFNENERFLNHRRPYFNDHRAFFNGHVPFPNQLDPNFRRYSQFDIEENERRRRELILSYHKQYNERRFTGKAVNEQRLLTGQTCNGDRQNETPYQYLADDIPISQCDNTGRQDKNGCKENLDNNEKTVFSTSHEISKVQPVIRGGQSDKSSVNMSSVARQHKYEHAVMNSHSSVITNGKRGENGVWSQENSSCIEVDSDSANDNASDISSDQSQHDFPTPHLSLDVFDDPMN